MAGVHPDDSHEGMDECDVDVDNEPVDPRVECLLDQLNNATCQINRVEGEHFLARKQYRMSISEANVSMEKLYKKSKKAIEKAKPYYDVRKAVDQARTKAAASARKYENACSLYEQAREALAASERTVMSEGSIDQIGLEVLNHATELVQESQREASLAEVEYKACNDKLTQLEVQLANLEKQHRKDIQKSEMYYSTRACITAELQCQADKVQALADKVGAAKYSYKDAFVGLETVSDEIHDRRKSQRRLTRRDSGFIEEIDTS